MRFEARTMVLVAAVAAALSPAPAAAADLRFGAQSLQGKFGSDGENRLWELPLEIVFYRATSRFTIGAPYVGIDHTGNVTMNADGPLILGAGGPGRRPFQTSPAGESQTGLGDVVLTDEMFFLRGGKGKKPLVALVLGLKLPTADRRKGLGTGKRDWQAGLSYTQPLGKVVQLLGDYAYRFVGNPEGVDLRDRPKYSAGLGFVVGRTVLRALYEVIPPLLSEVPLYDAAGTPIGVDQVKDRRFVRADLTIRSIPGGTTRLGVTKGLNGSSEDLGLLLEFSTGGR